MGILDMTIQQKPQPHITVASLSVSPKREGKFEKDIIPRVARFFQERNYETKEHVSMNLAWGKVLSEVDLVAVKNEIIIIEVKSKRDKITRAKKQLDKIRILSDYCFIASDTIVEPEQLAPDTGILLLKGDTISITREAKKIDEPVSKNFLLSFKKSHLSELCKQLGFQRKMNKEYLAKLLIENVDPLDLKREVKLIAFSEVLK